MIASIGSGKEDVGAPVVGCRVLRVGAEVCGESVGALTNTVGTPYLRTLVNPFSIENIKAGSYSS